jgi:hypothetical protein
MLNLRIIYVVSCCCKLYLRPSSIVTKVKSKSDVFRLSVDTFDIFAPNFCKNPIL